MKTARILAALVLVALLGNLATAQEKEKKATIDKDKLIGKWEPVKEPGTIIEMLKDGKLKVTMSKDDGKSQEMSGTYTWVEGKLKVSITTPDGDKVHTVTIKELTAEKMVTVDEKEKEQEFKKK